MKKSLRVFLPILFIMFLSFQAKAQKGVIANYKVDGMFLTFKHILTGENLKQPVLMGADVRIRYNISYQKLNISYTDVINGQQQNMVLRYVRNEQGENSSIIMEDGHGNPFTVNNTLQKNGDLGIVGHELFDEQYLPIIVIVGAKEVF